MAGGIVLATYASGVGTLSLARLAGERFGLFVHVVLMYTTIAIHDLVREARAVERHLLRGDLPAARRQVSRIVGRDTDRLDEAAVARAAVESVAESTVDGILSPIFYALIGGAPLALAFKAASTLDSMYGHLDEENREFGWASARLDDLANYVPARLAVFFAPLGALVCGRRWLRALGIAVRDMRKHLSPNAGIPEAAFAGALGVRLGGPTTYDGETIDKPWLGDALREIRPEDIGAACRLSLAASLFFVAMGVAVHLAAA